MGVANDVPFAGKLSPAIWLTHEPAPLHTTSGFIRPSEVGPIELKGAALPALSIAPTVQMLSASAGTLIKCHWVCRSFPAAFNTNMPLRAAIVAAMLIGAVLPFKVA